MHHIIYMSSAVHPPVSDVELGDLLRQARNFNVENGITGVLLHCDGDFLQVMEGEEQAIHGLYAKIRVDTRHQSVIKLADKEIRERSFSTWSMAFQPVTPAEFANVVGYMNPTQLDFRAQNIGAADSLLLHLVQSFVLKMEPSKMGS